MIIPIENLTPEALQGIITQFVSRDGPDSGHVETSLDIKISQVIQQLKAGKCVIVYDEIEQSCNIISTDDPGFKKSTTNK